MGFGFVNMIDDPLTEGPELSSKLLGRAQGLFGNAEQGNLALVMVMNFVFSEGKYNGSTLNILGRNSILLEVREMSIVGGTGLFRFARGYVQASTYSYTLGGDATVEYNAYVLHYDF
ncbi:Disease resistance-responsive (dirigent-like protein) family protein [Euphorbia peplus]|nr:Disease resistance-responsive (dirigent-like protein) family protein [Euphorbia peplus]